MLGLTIVSVILFGAVGASNIFEDTDSDKTTEWNGIRIEARATGGTIGFNRGAEQFQIRLEFGEFTHSVFIESETIFLASETLGIEGRTRLDVEGCTGVSVVATPDTLLLKVAEWHSSSSSSQSSRSATSGSTSTSASSSSLSTAVSTNLKGFGFAVWNTKKLELRLEGGNSIESAFKRDGDRCDITLDIDQGKNRRTISLKPGSLEIDGKLRHTGDDYSALFIAATKNSLRIKTDRSVIGSWKGDMDKKVLPD